MRLRLSTRTAYADLRGPMVCALITPAERKAVLRGLGPDPLRSGQPCLVCATPVATEQVAGRNLFWCPQCQALRGEEAGAVRPPR